MVPMERSWHKIASMDKKRLKDVMMICMGMNIKCHFADDSINPFAVFFYATSKEYKQIASRAGFLRLYA